MDNVIDLATKAKCYGPTANIGIIVQARMTSKRFPGKSLAMIDSKPVLQHVLERAKSIKAPLKILKPIKVILAVPDTPESEPMLQLADKLGIDNFCGSEDNVLQRYYAAASFFKLDVIMRITGDCPFIDPALCSEVLHLLLWRKLDYTSNVFPERTFPQGLDCEAFTFDCLEFIYFQVMDDIKQWQAAVDRRDAGKGQILIDIDKRLKDGKYDAEHVTPRMQGSIYVKRAQVKNKWGDTSKHNYCVDVPEDIDRLEKWLAKMRSQMAIRKKIANVSA